VGDPIAIDLDAVPEPSPDSSLKRQNKQKGVQIALNGRYVHVAQVKSRSTFRPALIDEPESSALKSQELDVQVFLIVVSMPEKPLSRKM
jgi:hypothetical protein